jgi:hypothetical protein
MADRRSTVRPNDADLCRNQRLMKAGDKRTGGLATPWLNGYYSFRSGLTNYPPARSGQFQGVGGICAITLNERRTVLNVYRLVPSGIRQPAKLEEPKLAR